VVHVREMTLTPSAQTFVCAEAVVAQTSAPKSMEVMDPMNILMGPVLVLCGLV
jgi:uncharacterized membrane protein